MYVLVLYLLYHKVPVESYSSNVTKEMLEKKLHRWGPFGCSLLARPTLSYIGREENLVHINHWNIDLSY